MILPRFQAQNPAISGYKYGWSSCTSFSGAMAAAFHVQKTYVMSGGALRNRTGDFTNGLTLAQIDKALNTYWGINLAVYYRMSWTLFAKMIDAGQGAVLQGLYAPLADSRFDGGNGFRGNHAIFVPPGWGAMDPLADGRYTGVYRYRGETYPRDLLRRFAGTLDLDPRAGEYKPLGLGYVYAAFTKDNVHSYHMLFKGGAFWVYDLGPDGDIRGRHAKRFSRATSASCGAPRSYAWPGHSNRTLVRMLNGALAGQYVGIPQSTVELEVVP